jgi:hypothetical protein
VHDCNSGSAWLWVGSSSKVCEHTISSLGQHWRRGSSVLSCSCRQRLAEAQERARSELLWRRTWVHREIYRFHSLASASMAPCHGVPEPACTIHVSPLKHRESFATTYHCEVFPEAVWRTLGGLDDAESESCDVIQTGRVEVLGSQSEAWCSVMCVYVRKMSTL